jgi:oligopeptide/dipeptide ABC transporter ATP-binding protein
LLVETRNLRVYFHESTGSIVDVLRRKKRVVKAVDGVSLSIDKNETVALVGETGSGKTTFGRALIRIYEPTSGSIIFDGTDITRLSQDELLPFRRKMQIVYQNPYSSLNPRRTVGRILGKVLEVHNISGGEQKVKELLRAVGLEESLISRYPHQLSGGQRQRVAIARALAVQPELIIADEITSSLDVSVQAQILNLLSDLQQQLRISFLFISHDLAVVRQISHKVAVMYLGIVVESGSSEELFQHPRHPYTQALIASIPSLDIESPWRPTELKGDIPSIINTPSGCRFHPRCPYAWDRCKVELPQLNQIETAEHLVACHLYDNNEKYRLQEVATEFLHAIETKDTFGG